LSVRSRQVSSLPPCVFSVFNSLLSVSLSLSLCMYVCSSGAYGSVSDRRNFRVSGLDGFNFTGVGAYTPPLFFTHSLGFSFLFLIAYRFLILRSIVLGRFWLQPASSRTCSFCCNFERNFCFLFIDWDLPVVLLFFFLFRPKRERIRSLGREGRAELRLQWMAHGP